MPGLDWVGWCAMIVLDDGGEPDGGVRSEASGKNTTYVSQSSILVASTEGKGGVFFGVKDYTEVGVRQ